MEGAESGRENRLSREEDEKKKAAPEEDVKKKKSAGRSSSAPPLEGAERERWEAAKRNFVRAAIADAQAYTDTTVEEVEEEYRRAGKVHRYNPETEWMKRLARVARKHPPPEGLVPDMDKFLHLLEEDEAN